MPALRLLFTSGLITTVALTPFLTRAADVPAPTASTDCVEARVGNERAFSLGCLNQRLSQMVEQAHGAAQASVPPIGPGSSPATLGLATPAAAQEMMGNALGKSAIPQRPNLSFGSPLLQTSRH
jgi:hypothetical protein